MSESGPAATLIDLRRQVRATLNLLAGEWRHGRNHPLPLRRRLACLRHGFNTRTVFFYGTEGVPDPRLYVSDWQEWAFSRRPNRSYGLLLDDKLLFWLMMSGLTPHVAALEGFIEQGRFSPLEGSGLAACPVGQLIAGAREPLVIKPARGYHGTGVAIIEPGAATLKVSGRSIPLEAFVSGLRRGVHVVAPPIRQASYSRTVFPGSANSIRLMTVIDVDSGEPFVPFAVHRFGSVQTAPLDAFFRGGVAAPIDIPTGRMGPALALPREGRRSIEAHPDTGARITGVAIPGWQAICEHMLGVARQLPFLPYIGWDIIVTDDGFVINEGNTDPSLRLLQTFAPALGDERFARFLRRYRAV
jgi:hypothetical protein